ncbi:GntR family transcriptional regulator [Streptomyces sp. NPDC006251]|uniref:GntR family transcriptional regulator n=1 Tax=Streptomyces sp. NPDC006251 TaxID=3155718 RepID=UPI0033A7F31C
MPNPAPRERAANAIRADILEGRFGPGEFLPGQRELARRCGVAFNTLGEALKELEAEGLIEVIPRRGSRVLRPASSVTVRWRTDGHVLPAGANALGAGTDRKVERRHATEEVAGALHGEAGMTVQLRRSVLEHDGAPWALRDLYFPAFVVDEARVLASPEYVDEEQALAEHGFGETGQLSHWSARPATAEEAQALKSGGSPVHVVRRISYCEDRPVCCELMTIRADRVLLSRKSGNVPSSP